MKTPWLTPGRAALISFMIGSIAAALAGPFQMISKVDPSEEASVGGNGDSEIPIVSPDGRYVLFASAANNLLSTASNAPLPSAFPPKLNVFLRDRMMSTTILLSVNRWGTDGGNADSFPIMISTNAQYVLFESNAGDLIAGDTNNAGDVFVRDLVNGTTTLVSVNTNGAVALDASRSATMTPDGRYVAFVSAASDLVPRDTNGIPDVFARDLVNRTTTLVSVGARKPTVMPYSAPFRSSSSESPRITPDGRFVAFFSTATNLVPAARTVGDVYLRDLLAGTTAWASRSGRDMLQTSFGTTNGVCYNQKLSDDGQFIAYEVSRTTSAEVLGPGIVLRYNLLTAQTEVVDTNACDGWYSYEEIPNLEMTPDGRFIAFAGNSNDTNGSTTCIYVWDGDTGTAVLASTNLDGAVPPKTTCDGVMLDTQARWVAFLSTSTNMVTNAVSGDLHLYLHDLQAGTTVLVNADTNGVGFPLSQTVSPCFSENGQFAVFERPSGFGIPGRPHSVSDIFLRDLVTGVGEVISVHAPGQAPVTANGSSIVAAFSASADGRYAAFVSDANNLAVNDTNLWRDVYVRDQTTGSNVLVSVSTNGLAGNNRSIEPAISGDGRYVVFSSTAGDLVAGDTNNRSDVFLRDLESGNSVLLSIKPNGTGPGNGDSYSPGLSSDARYVLFRSTATDLAAGSPAGVETLLLRDVQGGTNYALTTDANAKLAAALTPNGRYVAFVIPGRNMFSVWDSHLLRGIYTNSTTGLRSQIAISPDGRRVVTATPTGIAATTIEDNSTVPIAATAPPGTSSPGWKFSSDSRWFAYTGLLNGTNQVYLHDFLGGTNLLVSADHLSGAPASGNSDSPDISSDSRFVAFRSAASNLVPGDMNGVPDLFLFDRANSTMTLLTASCFRPTAANSRSLCPFFSSDGSTLLFQSWAFDLAASDFNQNLDVFAYDLYYSGAIPLFYAQLLPGTGAGQSPTLSWPTLPGKTYQVQFKNSLSETAWQDLSGGIVVLGNQAYFTEISPAPGQRFYRIIATDGGTPNTSGNFSFKQEEL